MKTKARAAGFSLIELMVVVVLTGIFLVVAMPGMRSLMESNRVAAEVNAFVGDVQFARSEAIKQGIPVVICASSNGTTCSNANNWTGWVVFADPDNTGGINGTETLLRSRPIWPGTDTFSASPSISAISYNRDGFAKIEVGTSTVISMTLNTAPVNASATRCVQLNRLGHQSVKAGSCA